MSKEVLILAGTAASLGFIHTILGPDHYLPFIVIAKAKGWNVYKTALITFLCGLGHVVSSVILGIVGLVLGVAVLKLEALESSRGDIASWFLIVFGFTYFIYGLHLVIRKRTHTHSHLHDEEVAHSHLHEHFVDHAHLHYHPQPLNLTPWVLFIIFVFGPCEPLIPLIMYPAAKHNISTVLIVAAIFSVTTILTMLAIVLPSFYGLAKLPLHRLQPYSHALAGLAIFLCGAAVKFLGL